MNQQPTEPPHRRTGGSVPIDLPFLPENTTAAIETCELTRRFGTLAAIDKVSLQVAAGEVFGLIGSNGAGKSTLIKMLTTLLPPTSGQARVGGFDVVAAPAQVRRHIGYVPQLLSADGALTGYENMLLSARLYAIPRAERESRIKEALASLDLGGAADRLVQHYSGGMIRRLEIAQSMLHRPAVLFMDEPTVGLDPVARRTVWDHVRALREAFGTTMFITTHYMEEADELCGRIAILQGGRLVAQGTPGELKERLGPQATLDDVFAHYTGSDTGPESEEGGYREVRQTRLGVREHG